MDYEDYIASPEWCIRRERALMIAGNHCQLCGAKNNLEIHHNTYEHLGNELDHELFVLCEPCHAKHHDRIPTNSDNDPLTPDEIDFAKANRNLLRWSHQRAKGLA